MTDREKAGLRGPVRTCLTEQTLYFRPSVCGPDGCKPAGDVEERYARHVCEYDANGNLPPRGERCPLVPEEFITWRDGRKVKLVRLPPELYSRPDTVYGYSSEGSDASYLVPGAAAIETRYNASEHPAEVLFLDRRGRRLSRVRLVCDGNGRVVEEHQFVSGRRQRFPFRTVALLLAIGQRSFRRRPFSSRFYRYDSRGRCVETRSEMGPLGGDCQHREYNEHGDKVKEVNQHQSRSMTLDWRLRLRTLSENRHRSEARMEYIYDERGNWVEQKVYGSGAPGQPFELSSLCRRTLEYYA